MTFFVVAQEKFCAEKSEALRWRKIRNRTKKRGNAIFARILTKAEIVV